MGPHLLLLDDDTAFIAEAQTSLTAIGCKVTALSSGDSGLARAVTDRFDLVLASAELRGVNGFRLCNRMKQDPRVRAVPVFLLTSEASASSVEGHRALPTRADVYLHKPIAMPELLAQVRSHVPALREPEPSDDEPTRPGLTLARRSVGPPPLPPSRKRADTIVGVAPAPRTQPPPPPKEGDGTIRRLAHELSAARREAEATAPLRARIAELQENMARLTLELGEARAAAAKAATEADGLRRYRASTPPPQSSPSTAGTASLRAAIQDRDQEILTLRASIESEQQTSAEAWERVRIAEEAAESLAQSARQRDEELGRSEKRNALALTERDSVARRAEEAVRRADRLKGEVEQARKQSEAREKDLASERAALAELRANIERSAVESKERLANAVAERDRAHAEQLGALRAEHESAGATLQRQLGDTRGALERAVAEARADAERSARTELEAARRDFERRLEVARGGRADLVEEAQRSLKTLTEERDWLVHEIQDAQSTVDVLRESATATAARHASELSARDAAHAEEARRLRAESEAVLATAHKEHDESSGRLRAELDATRGAVQERAQELAELAAEDQGRGAEAVAELRARTEALVRDLESTRRGLAAASDDADLRVAAARSEHAVAMTSLQAARDADTVRLRTEHGQEIDRLLRELQEERARTDETRRLQPGVEVGRSEHADALERVRRDAAEQLARTHAESEAAVATAEERARETVRAAEQERDRQVLAAQQAAALAEERRVREVADARAAAEAALARLDHEQVKMELQRDAAIADATLELRLALARAAKDRDEAVAEARTHALEQSEVERSKESEERMHEAAEEMRIELEGARAAAVAETRRAHGAELQRLDQERLREQSSSKARLDAMEQALTSAREALERERRARLEERTSAAARIDALEGLVATRTEDAERLHHQSTEISSELPALEGEIVVLRTDLTEMRRKLDEQTSLARAAEDQLERHRVLLARTRDSLAEVLGTGADDPTDDSEET
jgi:DNA-binding response OmpR family regulator